VTNLYGNQRFDLFCEREAWVGSGRYEATGDRLRLDFDVLTRRGHMVGKPAPIEMTYEGRGNELALKWRELNLTWRRHL
jgi:hypothetical protein